MELVISISNDGAQVRTEDRKYEGRSWKARWQVGRMQVSTPDGPMDAPVRIPLRENQTPYAVGDYVLSSESFDRSKYGNLEFRGLVLTPRAAAARKVA